MGQSYITFLRDVSTFFLFNFNDICKFSIQFMAELFQLKLLLYRIPFRSDNVITKTQILNGNCVRYKIDSRRSDKISLANIRAIVDILIKMEILFNSQNESAL